MKTKYWTIYWMDHNVMLRRRPRQQMRMIMYVFILTETYVHFMMMETNIYMTSIYDM